MSVPAPVPRLPYLALVVLLAILSAASPAHGQADGFRVGLQFGGISTVGLLIEYEDGQGSTEISVGTWAFRDISVSVVRRQRFGRHQIRPVVGLGLWGVIAFPEEGRTGLALVARLPVGAEWDIAEGGTHFLTADLNVNRALWVHRTDPEDDTPLNRRLVPLPGVAWRWRAN